MYFVFSHNKIRVIIPDNLSGIIDCYLFLSEEEANYVCKDPVVGQILFGVFN